LAASALVPGLVLFSAGAAVLIGWGVDRYRIYYASLLGDGLVVYSSKPGRMVHAEIYVVDDLVGIGSANLTEAAVRGNFGSPLLDKGSGDR